MYRKQYYSPLGVWLSTGIPLLLTNFLWLFHIIASGTLVELEYGRALSQVAGLNALTLFVLTLLFSTRLRSIEKLFSGFDRMYRWHKYVGITSTLLLLIHVFSIASLHLDQLWYYLLPNKPDGSLYSFGLELGKIGLYGIIVLLLATYIKKIPYHIWKKTHEWMGFFFIAGAIHSLLVGSSTRLPSPLGIWVLLLTNIGIAAFLYSWIGWKFLSRSYTYFVHSVESQNTVTHLCLQPADKQIEFHPGQFVFITIPNINKNEEHPFSISSGINDAYLRLSIKNLGDYTSKIQTLKKNDKVSVLGPYGSFGRTVFLNNKSVVFVAGGIGITPFISILRSIDPHEATHIDLFVLVQNQSHNNFESELDFIQKRLGNCLTIHTHFSDNSGYLRATKLTQNLTDWKEKEYYLCGPKSMMRDFLNDLIALGVPRKCIFLEDFSFK